MADVIRVMPEVLKNTAGEFANEAGQLKNLTNTMMETVNSLASVFEGDASMTYRARFGQLQDDMNRMFAMIQEHSNDLETMATNYINADSENTQIAAALSGDIIS